MRPGDPLLCAVDLDGRAGAVVAAARRLAEMTRLHPVFVHVCQPGGMGVVTTPSGAATESGHLGRAPAAARVADAPRRREREAVALAEAALVELDIDASELRIELGDPEAEVLECAHELRPALVLVAAGGDGGTGGAAPGSVCGALARDAGCPVVILPGDTDGSFPGGPIACAVSLGDRDEAAIRFAGAFARAADRRLVLSHIIRAQDAAAAAAVQAKTAAIGDALSGAERRSPRGADRDVAIRGGALAGRLLSLARDAGADALVVGTRRRGAISEALLGSVARTLWTTAPCPVIVVAG